MMTKIISVSALLCYFLLAGCSRNTGTEQTGEQVAKAYCSSCHLFPSPALLSKNTWVKGVLPVMGKKLGVEYYNGQAYPLVETAGDKGNTLYLHSSISMTNWDKIIQYYQTRAPVTLPGQNRPFVQQVTPRFTAREVLLDTGYPSTTYLKIDSSNKLVYAGNAADSSFCVYDRYLKRLSHQNIHGVIVDMCFDSGLNKPGNRSGTYTNIGCVAPNDQKRGSSFTLSINRQGSFKRGLKIADSLPRPVQVSVCDLDKDGKTDYLVCGFGNNSGEFYWLKNKGSGGFEKKVLWAIPGAIKAYVDDYNKDGLPDVMVLFAQAQEGIYLFTNKGNGNFEKKGLLLFPPVYGSSYFELDDFNSDGFKDILYCCGDNADFSGNDLKNYHGLYIFLNDGSNNFKQAYFFPMYGCFKAVARDFDKDGDLDIAAISQFPDKKNRPRESLMYLENKGNLQFTPYIMPSSTKGNWITMDAGDIDGDGYDDIIAGNFDLHKVRMASHTQQINTPGFIVWYNKATKANTGK